jgi:raffinose/stachyose/melibiose transport system permease protein
MQKENANMEMITNKKHKIKFTNIITGLFVALSAIIFLIPVYITFIGVFKSDEAIIRTPLALPFKLNFDNIKYVLSDPSTNILRMYLNTFFIVSVSMIVTLAISSMAAFYTSRSKTKGGKFLYIYFIFGLMIPYQIAFLGLVQIIRRLNMIGTYPAIIFTFISGNIMFSVFMYHGFMKSIPLELEEAAAIDGAGEFRIFWQVIMPLLKPCTTTIAIFIGLSMWNDFYTPLIILGGGKLSTITLGIYNSISMYRSNWGHAFTYVWFASLPVVIAYLIGQKNIISGLTSGALKG